jgi:hypothetical protein
VDTFVSVTVGQERKLRSKYIFALYRWILGEDFEVWTHACMRAHAHTHTHTHTHTITITTTTTTITIIIIIIMYYAVGFAVICISTYYILEKYER